ncbi:hypothetical protein AbraCBS73388_010823 [Aspergillus brasiliensis]|uniref:Uncharacterized protein n=1 Tax=Aspergillus brasiliensis TaxID=319629 RepID=A0A9W6DIL0_9EURO|nr:hypothetical protein AbraCBS73388_010823 [Aspergillus brasiliensis]
MQSCAGCPTYDFSDPWPFWRFVGLALSKAFFGIGNERQLELRKAQQCSDRDSVVFSNDRVDGGGGGQRAYGVLDTVELARIINNHYDEAKLVVVEVEFLTPVHRDEPLMADWRPASQRICQMVRGCEYMAKLLPTSL